MGPVVTARGFCTCKRDHPGNVPAHPAPGASWHYVCDKPVLPPARPASDWPPDLPETRKLAFMHGTAAETAEQAARALAEVQAAIADLEPPRIVPTGTGWPVK